MDLRQLEYVVAVADLGSFTQAAKRCFVVQSALSHQIAKLEQELGTRLFHRTSRTVSLTAAGETFVPAARDCLRAADRARSEVAHPAGELRGTLAIGVIPTVAAVDLPEEVCTFRERHPHVRVSLLMGGSADLVAQVAQHALDLAFLGLPAHASVTGVRSRVLARDELVAVMTPDHPLASAAGLTLRRLAQETFIDFPSGTGGRAQTDEAFTAAGLQRDVAYEVLDAHLMGRLIRARLGVAMLASTFAPQLADIVTVPVRRAPVRVEYVVWSPHHPSPATTAFLHQLDIDDGVPRDPPGARPAGHARARGEVSAR